MMNGLVSQMGDICIMYYMKDGKEEQTKKKESQLVCEAECIHYWLMMTPDLIDTESFLYLSLVIVWLDVLE